MAQFNDPAAYERYMGGWSRAAGEQFLDWLGQPHGLRWLDNGCGSGIFSELLWQQALPARLDGIDISPELLAHARQRPPQRITLHHGDANALPFAAGSFDATAMALVIVFLADALQALFGNFFAVDDLSRHGVAFVVVKRKAHYRIFTNGFTNSGNEAA